MPLRNRLGELGLLHSLLSLYLMYSQKSPQRSEQSSTSDRVADGHDLVVVEGPAMMAGGGLVAFVSTMSSEPE